MCWGAVQWSRLSKVYIGADRFTAAKYGFDDKVFYDEVEHHAEVFGLCRHGFFQDTNATATMVCTPDRHRKNMMEVHTNILKEEVESFFTGAMNKIYRRRFTPGKGMLKRVFEQAFCEMQTFRDCEEDDGEVKPDKVPENLQEEGNAKSHEAFMRRAIDAARHGAKEGISKEREPFGAVIVRGGQVIATGINTVLKSRDATATAEVNAIRAAARCLGTYSLQDCTLYCTAVPDVMSMAACLWARVPRIYCGVTQEFAMHFGHEDGWLHFHELMTLDPEKRVIPTVGNVAKPICEEVFKFWSSLQGKIY